MSTLTEEKLVAAADMTERPKLYYRVTFPHGYTAVLDPGERDEFIKQADEPPTSVEKIYLTDTEYEALPEFES